MLKSWRSKRTGAQATGSMSLLGLALAVPLLWAGPAQARREETYSYTFTRVWTTAVRLLRIDFGSPITEKDKESGYFLFEFADGSKQHPGSIEVVRVQESGADSVRVVVQIPALPSYVEQNLLDRLGRKLGQEYGTPIGAKPIVKPDAATDSKPEPGAEGATGTKPPAQPAQGKTAPKP
jgi:hypothetical protein